MSFVHNPAGLRLSLAGRYEYPVVEVNGEWVERTDIKWQTEPDPPAPAPRPTRSDAQRRRDHAAHAKRLNDGATEYSDGDLRVVVTEPWHVDDRTGTLEVRVLAFVDGELVEADDGRFQFENLPAGVDLGPVLLSVVRRVVER